MKVICILIMSSLSLIPGAMAQPGRDYRFAVGVRGGVNVANVSQNKGNARVGGVTGIITAYRFNQNFGLSGDVCYTSLGYSTKEEQRVATRFLEVPIQLTWYVGRRVRPPLRARFHLGVAPVFLLNVDASGNLVREQLNGTGINLVAGYGVEYRLGDKWWFQFDSKADTGLLDYRKSAYQGEARSTIKNLQFSVGIICILIP